MGAVMVTGASGQLGRRIVRRLAERGVAQRLLTRDLSRAFEIRGATWVQGEYGDAARMHEVFDGIPTLLLMSGGEARDRVERHVTAIDAAVAVGVERIVYVSFLGAAPDATFTFARDHWHTEQHVRGTGVAFTFLRDSLYQDVLPEFVGTDGALRGPAGEGRVGAVTRDDIADAAVAVLTGGGTHDGLTYDLTGPEALDFVEVADLLAAATGHPVRYHPETVDEAFASRAEYGAEDWEVTGWVSTYLAVANGELDAVTDAVESLSGRRPTSFATHLERSPDVIERLRSRLAAR